MIGVIGQQSGCVVLMVVAYVGVLGWIGIDVWIMCSLG